MPISLRSFRTLLLLACGAAALGWQVLAVAVDPPAEKTAKRPINANRLTYLDDFCDPYVFGLNSPKLTTPQWVGEAGVDAVITLGIDDMRDPARYETYLRPILERLQKSGAKLKVGQNLASCEAGRRGGLSVAI